MIHHSYLALPQRTDSLRVLLRCFATGIVVAGLFTTGSVEADEMQSDLHAAKIALAQAKYDQTAAEINHQRALEKAKLSVDLARLDEDRFTSAESSQERDRLESDVMMAEKRSQQAKVRADWSRRLANQGLISEAALELDEGAAKRTESTLKLAREQLRLFEEMEFERRLGEAQAAVDAANAKLDRLRSEGQAKLRIKEVAAERAEIACQIAAETCSTADAPTFPTGDDRQWEIALEEAEASLHQARVEQEAQQKFFSSEVRRADLAIRSAELELSHFREVESVRKLQEQRDLVRGLAAAVEASREQLAWSRRVFRKGYLTPAAVEEDRLQVTSKEVALESAKSQLELLRHVLKRRELELAADVAFRQQEKDRLRSLGAAEASRSEVVVDVREEIYAALRAQLASGESGTGGG